MATHYFECPCLTTLSNIQYSQHHTHCTSTRSSLVTKGLIVQYFSQQMCFTMGVHRFRSTHFLLEDVLLESLYNRAVLYLRKHGIAETADYIRIASDIITFIAFVYKVSLSYVIELFNLNHIYNARPTS
jgi:hypothetical protein